MSARMSELYINIEDARWVQAGLEPLADQVFSALLSHMDLPLDMSEISLLGCDDARISILNADFRQKPQPTNVLSWPTIDYPRYPGQPPARPDLGPSGIPLELGDIAISYDTCAREAAAQGKEMHDHVSHLLVHGALHLLGFDHIDDKDACLMEHIEVEILGKLGISDPYRNISE